jgi:hypothetical protein
MDVEKKGIIYCRLLNWFDEERKRQIKKTKLRPRDKGGGVAAMRKRLHALRSLQAFTAWLRYQYGPHLFHPWRRGIDRDGSMTVTRLELSTFCKNAGWRGDTNALWHALDSDESGSTSLDEFAGSEARQLALFKKWTDAQFGNVRKMFNALVLKCRKKGAATKYFDKHDFCFACQALGYHHDPALVFDILDWEAEGDDQLSYKELKFLDSWTPAEWLSAEAKPEAADAFRAALRKRYKHPMKAWRALDDDGSGKVNFKEFQVAAARVGFHGDVNGAWMALDTDASGYIALMEIDPQSASMLADFRRWANLFFGGVLDAFRVLDADEGGSLSRAEFKKSVTKFSFRGDRESIFTLLDAANDGDITVEEMAFLDEWEISEVADEPIPSFQEVEAMLTKYRPPSSHGSSASDSDDDVMPYQRKGTLPVGSRANPRGVVMLAEADLPISLEDQAKIHRPMPGPALVELLGVFDTRIRTGSVQPLAGHSTFSTSLLSGHETSIETSFLATGSGLETSMFSMGSSRYGSHSHSHFCSRGPQRSRKHRLRKVVAPYTGGAALMPPKVRPQRAGQIYSGPTALSW